MPFPDPAQNEPFLLTPGPLTTSAAVKRAMLKDWGSWDDDFRAVTREIRQRLLAMLDTPEGFDCVPMQGSGTFSVEAMLGSFIPRDGKALVLSNGAYGQRITETLAYLGRAHTVIDKGDYLPPRGADVRAALKADLTITHVVAVHCETSSGILNPPKKISDEVHAEGRTLLIDSMSAFGALPLTGVRYAALVSSANKCIEGVPGFGFVIAQKPEFEAAKGRGHSLALDVHAQWATMNKTGQWRFTPPTHAVVAFLEALKAHEAEGGVAGRCAHYAENLGILGISEIKSGVKCDDTVSGVGEALNAGCWGVGPVRYSNYMNINSLEEEATLSEGEIARRMAHTRKILEQSGAHYVIDSLVDLPAVLEDINARLARGEKP